VNGRNSAAAQGSIKSMRRLSMNTMRLLLGSALLAALSALGQMPSVPGEPARATKATVAPVLRLPPGNASKVILSPITDAELAGLRQANQRMQEKRVAIGVVRDLGEGAPLPSARDLSWTAVSGGFAAQVALQSPSAGAMRISIDLSGVAEAVEMVFFGSDDPGRLLGPVRVGSIKDRSAPWWSPLTDGDAQTVELFVPGAFDPRVMNLRIAGASHVFTTIASRFEKRVVDIGTSGSCNVDIQCSPLVSQQAFLNVRNAVAQMVFTDPASPGFVDLCTGQLLNDSDPSTQIPWFYSANHCFDNESLPHKTAAQMQTLANSLNTLWFFEAVTCGATTTPAFSQLIDGAAFIFNNPAADSLFLRLNSAPPAGAFFAGWDANPVPVGSSIVVIHHPNGDLKKVSQGSVIRYSPPQPSIPGGASSTFSEVQYVSGTTEGGSSGSGLYTFDGTQYRLRGALYGGGAACSAITDSDWYSQFDKVYPSLAQYLGSAATIVDYSDIWWNPNESGMGLNIVQHASRNIFAIWFIYDANGRPLWFAITSGTWNSATNTFTAPMYQTSGPAASEATFNGASVKVTPVGTAMITFTDANNATLAYTVNGVIGSKVLTREPF
jgi:lysyl endopeptidase